VVNGCVLEDLGNFFLVDLGNRTLSFISFFLCIAGAVQERFYYTVGDQHATFFQKLCFFSFHRPQVSCFPFVGNPTRPPDGSVAMVFDSLPLLFSPVSFPLDIAAKHFLVLQFFLTFLGSVLLPLLYPPDTSRGPPPRTPTGFVWGLGSRACLPLR